MYTYVSDWTVPRARWGEMEKDRGTDKIFEKAFSAGTLVGYGDDLTLVHTAEGTTHDAWWSATSLAGILNVLDELHKAGTSPVLNSATKHSDAIYISRYYSARAGTYHGAYTRESSYKLKSDAPEDAMSTLAKTAIVPLLEKLVADGTLLEYEIDEEFIHTQSPDTFWIISISPTAEGQDKLTAGIHEALKGNSLIGPAFNSFVDFSAHRDGLARTNAVYK